MALGDIISSGESNADRIQNTINFESVDRYIIELIRISELYKFELRIKPKKHLKKTGNEMPKAGSMASAQSGNGELNKKGIEEEMKGDSAEAKQYLNAGALSGEDGEYAEIFYNNGAVRKDSGDYKAENPKKERYQELWEKIGFYQEKTTQVKVRVQLWPEHLPYDHYKRKRAFLFV